MTRELVEAFVGLFKATLEHQLALCNRTISREMFVKVMDVVAELFAKDFAVDEEPTTTDQLEHARWRDQYNRTLRNRKKSAEWCEVVAESLVYVIIKLLPKTEEGPFSFEIQPTHEVIRGLTSYYIVEKNHDFFRELRKPLSREIDKNAPPTDLLRGTPLAQFFPVTSSLGIPLKTFMSHGIIVAPPNHGKSQLLGTFLKLFLEHPDKPGAVLLDPHGDLFDLARTRVPPERLVVLNPDVKPPPLNFLDFGNSTEADTLQTFAYLMSSLSGGLSDKQGAIVPYLLKLLRRIPNASLETLRQIVDEKVKRPFDSQFMPAISTLPTVDQGFFHNQFYSSRMQETKDAIGWKLYAALSSNAFREMFSAPYNSFSADKAMNEGKVVLVKGSRKSLGDEGMKVFLQFLVAQYFSAALRRESVPPHQRKPCILCIDEAHHVFNSQTSNILTECRKYGLGFLAATQVIQQIPEDVKAAIYGATAIKIAGPVAHSDAMILSREMYTTGDFIRSCRAKERSHAEWACYVSQLTGQAVKITAPYGQLDTLPTHQAESRPVERPSQPVAEASGVSEKSIIPPPATIDRTPPIRTKKNKTEPSQTKSGAIDYDTDH
jgi:hypothetical protein